MLHVFSQTAIHRLHVYLIIDSKNFASIDILYWLYISWSLQVQGIIWVGLVSVTIGCWKNWAHVSIYPGLVI